VALFVLLKVIGESEPGADNSINLNPSDEWIFSVSPLTRVSDQVVSHPCVYALQLACAMLYLLFVSNDVMITILEPSKFSIKGTVNVHVVKSVKCHLTVDYY